MQGYFNNPEATSSTITADGWLRTGDIGLFREDGSMVITDRAKELIKYKGFQVRYNVYVRKLSVHMRELQVSKISNRRPYL